MLSHVYVGISDFDRAFSFYASVMAELGNELGVHQPEKSWAGWRATGQPRPLFLIGTAFNGEPVTPGNGQMVGLLASTRDAVDQAYAAAMANGGADEGAPGLRPQYHANYYGAYFRDPDGNKLCVVCHEAPRVEDAEPASS